MKKQELYQIYLRIPKSSANKTNEAPITIYPSYCVIEGRSIRYPHPHRHYTFEEFSSKIDYYEDFKKFIENYVEYTRTR